MNTVLPPVLWERILRDSAFEFDPKRIDSMVEQLPQDIITLKAVLGNLDTWQAKFPVSQVIRYPVDQVHPTQRISMPLERVVNGTHL